MLTSSGPLDPAYMPPDIDGSDSGIEVGSGISGTSYYLRIRFGLSMRRE